MIRKEKRNNYRNDLDVADQVVDLARLGLSNSEIERYLQYQIRVSKKSDKHKFKKVIRDISEGGDIAAQLSITRSRVTKRIPTTSINIAADIVRDHRMSIRNKYKKTG